MVLGLKPGRVCRCQFFKKNPLQKCWGFFILYASAIFVLYKRSFDSAALRSGSGSTNRPLRLSGSQPPSASWLGIKPGRARLPEHRPARRRAGMSMPILKKALQQCEAFCVYRLEVKRIQFKSQKVSES